MSKFKCQIYWRIFALIGGYIFLATLRGFSETTRAISSILASNKVTEISSPKNNITDPDFIALQSLNQTSVSARLQLPHNPGIATISNRISLIDTKSIENRIEKIKTKDLIRESQELAKKSRKTSAISLLDNALKTVTSPDAIYTLSHQAGLLYYSLTNYPLAAKYLEQALKAKPDNVSVTCNLAALLLYLDDTDKALEKLSEIELKLLQEPHLLFNTHFNFACAYSLRKESQKALAHLELAAHHDPANTYASLGDTMLDNIREENVFKLLENSLAGLLRKNVK